MSKVKDNKMDKRYWIDDNPIKKPFGESTYGIVDEKADGVVLYTGTAFLAESIKILLERNEGGMRTRATQAILG